MQAYLTKTLTAATELAGQLDAMLWGQLAADVRGQLDADVRAVAVAAKEHQIDRAERAARVLARRYGI